MKTCNNITLVSCFALLVTLGLTAGAEASNRSTLRQSILPNSTAKSIEATEKHWNPLLGRPGVQADVAEVEPNDDFTTANAFACGDDYRPANIDFPDDIDFMVISANAGDLLTFGTDADGATGQIDDTIIGIFDDLGNLLDSDDDSGPGFYSLLSDIPAPYTGTYYLAVIAFDIDAVGAYKAFLRCTAAPPPPVNDDCAGAIDLPCKIVNISGTTFGATDNYTPALPGGGGCTGFSAFGADIVYTVTLEDGGSLSLDYTSEADGSIYLLNACVTPGDAACVAGADLTFGGETETLNYTNLTGGTVTYYLILDNFGTGAFGAFTLTGTVSCPPVPVEASSWGSIKARFGN